MNFVTLHIFIKFSIFLTFFIWNLMVALISSVLLTRFSPCVTTEGNLFALFRPDQDTGDLKGKLWVSSLGGFIILRKFPNCHLFLEESFKGFISLQLRFIFYLLDERLRGEEGVVGLGEFLDQFLVLVELLEVVRGLAGNARRISLVQVVLSEHK